MRHRDTVRRLTQKPAHARMLKRNLVTSLLLYESIRTTKARARAIQPVIDRLIVTARKNPPHKAIRYINQYVTDRNASRKIMEVLIHRYSDRNSGLTSVKPAGARVGDGAMLVDLSLVDGKEVNLPQKEVKKAKEKKKKAVNTSPASASDSTEKEKTSSKKTSPKTSSAKSTSSQK